MRILTKKIFSLWFLCLSITSLITSCSTSQYGYPPDGAKLAQTALLPSSQKKLEVIPFIDSRLKDSNSDYFILWLIPPFPYGFGDYEQPEKADFFTSISNFKFDPSKDIARDASTSFEASNLFNQVQYSNSPGKLEADYIMSGEIHSTRYTGRRFSYCSSFLTVIWWTIGAPLGTSYNRISITLYLKDRQGNTVWQYSGDKDDYTVDWMYSPYDDCNMYPELTNAILNEAVMDMYNKALENPKLLN